MASIMITCPATGRQVFTGIETHPASVAMLPPINTQLVCPACGSTHVWSMLDAELVPDPDARPEVSAPELQLRIIRLRERVRARSGPRPPRRSLPRTG